MKRKSIGEVLRDTRELHGWTLEDVQYMTNIPSKFIQALEYNDFDVIPDEAYRRVFLEHYAETLQLDAKVVMDAFDSRSMLAYYANEPDELMQTSERLSDEDLMTAAFEKVIQQKKRRKRAAFLPIFYLILAALTIVILITYVVLSHAQGSSGATEANFSLVNKTSLVSRAEAPLTPQDDILGVEDHEMTAPTASPSLPASSSLSASSSPEPTEPTTSTSQTEDNPPATEPIGHVTTTGQDNHLQVEVSRPEDKQDAPVTLTIKVEAGTESWISIAGTDHEGGLLLNDEQPQLELTLPADQASTAMTIGYAPHITLTVNGHVVDLSQMTASPGELTLQLQ